MTLSDDTTFSDLVAALAHLPVADPASAQAASQRQAQLTKPPGSLGRLEELAVFMAGWQRSEVPVLRRAQVLVAAGNHGVCAQGVNPYPQAVTMQMVANFRAGGAAINQLAHEAGAELSVLALDLDRPTTDFTQGPAMAETEVLEAMASGAAAVEEGIDLLMLGEMGIGNSTTGAALCAAIFGGVAEVWVGPGTGATGETLRRKIGAVDAGLALHAAVRDPLGILAAFGGREQAAICGAIIEARARSIPVILDGFICTASAAVLHAISPSLLDHCLAGHVGAEPGHRRLLAALDKQPLLDLGLRLGEGTGAVLALQVLRGALACHAGMATFAEAGVADG